MKYKLCLFDFDYTLADTTKPIVESFRHTFKTMNLEGFDREKAIKTLRELENVNLVTRVRKGRGKQDMLYVNSFVPTDLKIKL